MNLGRHRDFRGTDAGADVSAAFATRAHGAYSQLRGHYLEARNDAPKSPNYRARRARILWAKLNRGELEPATIAAVRRDFAREFAQFAREGVVA